jgi:hypothetical protein
MKLSMMRNLVCAAAVAGAGMLAAPAAGAPVFLDTFDYSGSPDPQTNLAADLAARQAGGAVGSSYTEQKNGPASNDAALSVDNGLDTLRFRTLNNNSASQIAVDLGTNFASQLAGNYYAIRLTDVYYVRSDQNISDVWLAISVGDESGTITGPNQGEADVAVLARPRQAPSNNYTRWEDGGSAGPGATTGLTNGFDYANRFAVIELRVDEVAGQATAYFEDANGNSHLSNPWAIDFDNNTSRRIEIRAHQGTSGGSNETMDVHVDAMSIELIPEPASLALLGLGGLALLRRKA